MNRFGKVVALLFGVCISMALTSCGGADDNSYVATNDYDTVLTEERYDETDKDDDATEPITQAPFTGEIVPRSEFLWQDERDQGWEMDVRHFAAKALRQHPLLIDFDFGNPSLAFGLARDDYYLAAQVYEGLLRRAIVRGGIEVADDSVDGMRKAFRDYIIQRTNELILDIPYLNDDEILFSLAAMGVLFIDHTRMGLPMGDVFPMELISLYNGIYFIGLPARYESALYGELIAINDIGIDEIVERFTKIISHESEHYLRNILTAPVEEDLIGLRHYVVRPFLAEFLVLNYLSVVDDSGRATFTIRGIDGEVFDIRLSAMDRADAMDYDSFARHEFRTLHHMNSEEVFWYEYFSKESLLYVRINTFVYRSGADFQATSARLMEELENWTGTIERIVIDFRQNPGGVFNWPTSSDMHLISELSDSVYVIIDAGTYSQAVITTSNITRLIDNVIVIGEPAGQIDNMFAGDGSTLPRSGMRYNVAQRMWIGSDSDDIALRPDIFIPLTIDDVMNSRDPVMDFIFGL